MTLICEDDHSPAQRYTSWYHNWAFWKAGSGTIQIYKSGRYTCKTQRSSVSDPVHVEFLSGEERKGFVSEIQPLGTCLKAG